jgi:hypothetical protein
MDLTSVCPGPRKPRGKRNAPKSRASSDEHAAPRAHLSSAR